MSAFQELVQNGRMDMDYLTTHSFDLEDAPDAYDLILARDEPYLGVLIRYTADSMPFATRIDAHPAAPPGRINVAFIGAGSYAQSHLLPNVEGADVVKRGVFTASGTNSKSVLERYGFEFCTATESDILESKIIDTVFVATWHNTHADYVGKCVAAGKNVFVEKPLAMDVEQLDAVAEAVASQREAGVEPRVMVGYNRRFSPLTVAAVDHLGKGPMTMLYRVNAGDIPLSSWIQDPDLGGGRIIGEVCHFVDYFMHACGSVPVSVYATASADPEHKEDCVVLNLAFANGSVGTICYLANGPRSLPKEYVELYRAGSAAILRDFREVELFGSGRTSKKKLLGQNKGQKAMVGAWLDAIREGRQSPISFEELFAGTRATLGAIASIRHGQVVRLV